MSRLISIILIFNTMCCTHLEVLPDSINLISTNISAWDKQVKYVKEKDMITTGDVYKLVSLSIKCRKRLNLVIDENKIITGLPLFNIASNQILIRESANIVIAKCKG